MMPPVGLLQQGTMRLLTVLHTPPTLPLRLSRVLRAPSKPAVVEPAQLWRWAISPLWMAPHTLSPQRIGRLRASLAHTRRAKAQGLALLRALARVLRTVLALAPTRQASTKWVAPLARGPMPAVRLVLRAAAVTPPMLQVQVQEVVHRWHVFVWPGTVGLTTLWCAPSAVQGLSRAALETPHVYRTVLALSLQIPPAAKSTCKLHRRLPAPVGTGVLVPLQPVRKHLSAITLLIALATGWRWEHRKQWRALQAGSPQVLAALAAPPVLLALALPMLVITV